MYKMQKHEQAFEMFKASGGTVSNADIAKEVGATEQTVRKWKSRYHWLDQMGIEKNVTPKKQASVTKSTKISRDVERKRVIDSLIAAGTYSPAFDLLIEIYLDAYVEYLEMRKNGEATEKNRREIAKLLGQLGLDGKNKEVIKRSGQLLARGDEENKKDTVEPEPVSELDMFRMRKKGG